MQEGGLEVRDVENLRRHYARTCAHLDREFRGQRRARSASWPIRRRFRIWHVYLAGCAYAFAHDWISLYQIVCGKAGAGAGGRCRGRAATCTRHRPGLYCQA